MERRLSAILAADVVGYSTLMERDEAGTHERLKARRWADQGLVGTLPLMRDHGRFDGFLASGQRLLEGPCIQSELRVYGLDLTVSHVVEIQCQ